jgi:ferredoxin-NADP reductase/Na+-translocating ferredoxin:NAD+ oxidoreductase RnfD subunit
MNDLRIWADKLLGQVTMYRQIIYALLTIAVFSLGLMMSGYLSYSPISFVASIVFAVALSYGSNRLFGWLFGVRPHAESAIITALILVLLFSPPATLLGAIKLGLIVVIANASKYLLVIRGRHIFNPAAVAIVVGSISGLAYATWWIATPGLLAVTIVVVGLILYKNHKFQIALTFVAAAFFIIVVQSILRGNVSLQVITAALTSWPLIFIAGIMLTEPLTMAPRKKQQLIIAGGTGVLMTLPLHYGTVLMTPALALLFANAASFWLTNRKNIKLRFVSSERHGTDGYELLFDAAPLSFIPGQYIEISLPHKNVDSRGSRRVFSIIGHPQDSQISIATRIPEKKHSSFKQALSRMKPGQIVYGTRIAGDFVLPEDTSLPIVCIAGGIGITPYISFLMHAAGRKITIIYVDQLRHHNAQVVIVSPGSGILPDNDWKHEKGHMSEKILAKYVQMDSYVYISGSPSTVLSTKQYIHDLGVKHVYTDEFIGY